MNVTVLSWDKPLTSLASLKGCDKSEYECSSTDEALDLIRGELEDLDDLLEVGGIAGYSIAMSRQRQ